MNLKRVMAMLLSVILMLVTLNACAPVQTTSSVTDQTSSLVSNGSTDGTPVSSEQDTSESQQNSVQQENSSQDGIVSDNPTSGRQDVSEQETPTQDNTTQCNHDQDPYGNVNKTEFYANYSVACCNQDAAYRSKHGLLSGSLDVPGQYAVEAENRPKSEDKFIRNTSAVYKDNGNTYVVLDATGKAIMYIHKSGGYITLEEVAAYMYAFGGNGQLPANYISKKKGDPTSSIWGEYLRVNHSYFIGDTDKYPYEPELPNITGCGGTLRYYEIDIGTTGTATPGYAAKPYIQGSKINRGAARLVYARYDLNNNGAYENDEIYVFYTHNHYNDFREYLNYYGGWGEMFGNVTGGGEYSSETNANPTPYVITAYKDFAS